MQLPKLPKWNRQIEAEPDLFDPFHTEIPFFTKFGVALGNVFRRMAGPEVPKCFRTFRLLQMSDPEAAEYIKAPLHVFDGLERRMQAISQRVGLQDLGAGRSMKSNPFLRFPT